MALYGNVTWITAGYVMPTNKWLHITLVRDSGTTKFYVNGVQTSGTSGATPGSPSDYFEVGNEPGQGRYFNGKVDEPKVYNYALTAAQVKSSMYTYYLNTIGYTMSGNMTTTSSFNNLTFNGTSGKWDFGANSATVANDLTITNGTVIAPSTTLTVSGNYSNSGTFTNNSGTVLFNATDAGNTIAGTLSSTSKFYNLTFNGVSGAWSFTSNPAVEVANDLTITNGTVTSTSGNLTITGNYSNSGTFTNNSGGVNMNATDSGNTLAGNLSGSSKFYTLYFTGSGGAWSFTSNPTVEVSQEFYIGSNSTVTSTSGNLIISTYYSNDGTFTHNSGTVLMNSTDSGGVAISGDMDLATNASSFYNLTFNGISGNWIFFSNAEVDVQNDLTIINGTVRSTTYPLRIKGNYSNSGTFTHMSGTVEFIATDSGNTIAGNLSGTSKFYNLTFNGVAGAWSFTSNPDVEVANNLTITNGTITATSGNTTVTGNYSNSATFTHNSGTVIFNATDAGNTLAGTLSGTSSFYNLTFSGAAGAWSFTSNPSVTIANALSISNGTLTATSGTTTIGGNFTKTGGTFTHNSGTVVFNDNTKISTLTYNVDIVFSSFTVSTASKQMKFDNVDKTTIAGTFTINGSACGTAIQLYSDSDTNQFDIDATGTVSITYADIQDSNAITALSATNSVAGAGGNNTNWTITAGACGTSISVTGVCYAFDEVTGCGDTGTITIAFGNSIQAQTEATVSASWTVPGMTAPSSGTIVTIFIDGAANTDEAVAVTKYDGTGDITGVKLYKENLTIGSVDNQTLSNSELGTYDNSVSGDEDIFFDVTTNNLVVDATAQSTTEKLTIVSGNTHQPGGTVSTHDLTNLGTFLPQGNTITIQGSYLNSGTLTSSTSLFNMTGTASETLAGTLSGATGKLYNITFDGSGGAWSFTSNPAVEVANDININVGNVTSTSGILTISGNFYVDDLDVTGNFIHSSGTVIFNATDSGNTITASGADINLFYNLTFNGSGGSWSFPGGGNISVVNDFTITNGTIIAPSTSLTVSGNYSNSGTFTHNNGTVLFNATDSGNTIAGTLSGSSKFYNLTFNGIGGAWSFTSNPTVEVQQYLNITNGNLTSTSNTLIVTNNYSNTGTFTHNNGTVLMNATDAGNFLSGTLSGSSKFYNLTFNGVAGGWNFTSNPAVEVANDFTITNGTVTATSGNTTITGNYSNSGVFTNNSGTVIMNATDGGNTLAGTLSGATGKFYNLTFDGVSGAWSFTANPAVEVNNNLTITNGTVTATSGNTTITGNYSNAGTFTHGSGTVIMNATDAGNTLAGTLSSASSFYNLTFNGSGGAWSFTSNPAVTVDNNLTITTGTVTSTSNTLTITGNYSNSGTFTHGSGTVTFNATDSGNTIGGTLSGATGKFYNLTFDGVAGAWSFTSNPAVEVANNLTITNGTVTSTSNTLTVTGNYSNSGTFTHNSGTVLMNATDAGNTLAGTLSSTSSFYNLTFNGVAGAWSFTSNPAVTVANNFTITNGTVTSTSGNLTVTGNYQVRGTFTHNNGTVTFNATDTGNTIEGTTPSPISTASFYNLTFNGSGGSWGPISNPPTVYLQLTVDNDFTITNGTFIAPYTLIIFGNYTNNGTFTHNNGTVSLKGTSKTLSGNLSGTSAFSSLYSNYSGASYSVTGGVDVETMYEFYIQGTTFTSTTGNLINRNTFLVSSASFVHNNGTVKLYGSTFDNYTNPITFYNLIIYSSIFMGGNTTTMTIDNDFTIASGSFNPNNHNLIIKGNYSNSGTFTNSSKTVTFAATDAGNTIAGNLSGTSKFYNLVFNGVAGAWSFTSNPAVEVANDLTITNGTVTSTSGNLTVTGNYSNAGTFTHNSGTMIFNATDAGNTLAGTMSSTSSFYNLTFSGAAGAWSFTSNPAVTVANALSISNGTVTATSNTTTIGGNFTKTGGTYTHNSGTVVFNDNTKVSTLTYDANTTFSAFTVSTVSKQMKFDNIDRTIVVGTFTINGAACGTPIELFSDSNGNQFDIDLQATVSIDYAKIQDSNAITAATANNTVPGAGGNNTNWTINGGACNSAPNSPTSLAQKTTGDVVITTGGWNNTTSIKFTATADDPNNPDTIYLCVEYQQLGTGFTNTETGCGTGVAYSGTPVTVTVTLNSIPDAFEYHWQARLKDTASAYSSWVSYDVNAESARDYGIDTTAPTLSTINDGTSCGSDVTFNNGSLSSVSACWAQATATISGLTKYQYSVGTTAGATDVLTWTDLVDGSANVSLTINSLTLQTSQQYYINVKAIDNATNTSGVISTNGQLVAPTISFSLNSSAVTFANLNGGNSYTDTKTSTLTTSTNAYNGYVVRAYKSQLLTNTSNPSYTIPDFSAGSYAAPSAWSGTGYGYTSSDTSIQGAGKFPGSGSCLGSGTAPCYAPFSSTAPGDIVADHTATVTGSPISSEQFTITYKVATPATQAGGKYTTTIVYTIVPQY